MQEESESRKARYLFFLAGASRQSVPEKPGHQQQQQQHQMALSALQQVTVMCVARASAGLSRCLLRLNPPQIAVGMPNRGQRDREPRRVSQPLIIL